MRGLGEARVRAAAAMCAAAVLAMSAGACASASGGMGSTSASSPDAAAFATAAAINMAEVEEAQLALQMASGAEARQFAQRMITEHGPMLQRVQETMRAMGMTPAGSAEEMDGAVVTPSGFSEEVVVASTAAAADPATMRVVMENPYSRPLAMDHQRAMEMLRNTPRGMAFDHAYLQRQVEAHRSALTAIDNLMRGALDTETQGLLAQMRPTVEQHLRMAEQMVAGMNH